MRKTIGMAMLLAALSLIIYMMTPFNAREANLQNLTRHIALLAIFAIGEGLVIISGGIDLSVGAIIAFAGVFLCLGIVEWGIPPILVILIILIIGGLIGLWHGFLVSRLRMQPFIVTLCTMLIIRGHARVLTGDESRGFGNLYEGVRALGAGDLFDIPIPVIIMVGVAIIAAFFMHFSVYGRYLYAIGRNEQAAEYSGIKVGQMLTIAYIACGALAALAGILYACYTNSVMPNTDGMAYELYAIAAAVLGGCSLRGGEGTIIGILIGAAIMQEMKNGIILSGIASQWEYAVIGYVILAGVIADSIIKQHGARRIKPKHEHTLKPPSKISRILRRPKIKS